MSPAVRSPVAALALPMLLVAAACTGPERDAVRDRDYVPPPVDTTLAVSGCHYPAAGELAAPAELPTGWDGEALRGAREYWETLSSAALVALHRGRPVASWGRVSERFLAQSVRKSLLNSLYGVAVRMDSIDPGATLEELDVGDTPSLTPAERSATVEHLLLSRSGVYHSAIYDPSDRRPERGSHEPGSHWFYNNWDFNALGTIFQRETGRSVHGAFQDWIAGPLGMEDYRPSDVEYVTRRTLAERFMGNESDHPAYMFSVSTRDLARFGLLYLCGGRWRDRQVLPASWVERTMDGMPTGEGYDYGYLWRIDRAEGKTLFDDAGIPGEIWIASGSRGHLVVVAPALELVVAHQVATRGAGSFAQLRRLVFDSPRVRWVEFERLLSLLVEAHPSAGEPAPS